LSHLRRAHLFLLTKVEDLETSRSIEKKINEIHPRADVFRSHYRPTSLVDAQGKEEELDSLVGKKILALSGIAHPDSFSLLLRRCGAEIVREAIFPDHHRYRSGDLSSIKEESKRVDWIVTTEKDMLKLRKLGVDDLPVRSLRIEMKIWEEEAFFERVLSLF
jgi:tetraacyldisaccharide-1-P 4'-kinase